MDGFYQLLKANLLIILLLPASPANIWNQESNKHYFSNLNFHQNFNLVPHNDSLPFFSRHSLQYQFHALYPYDTNEHKRCILKSRVYLIYFLSKFCKYRWFILEVYAQKCSWYIRYAEEEILFRSIQMKHP